MERKLYLHNEVGSDFKEYDKHENEGISNIDERTP